MKKKRPRRRHAFFVCWLCKMQWTFLTFTTERAKERKNECIFNRWRGKNYSGNAFFLCNANSRTFSFLVRIKFIVYFEHFFCTFFSLPFSPKEKRWINAKKKKHITYAFWDCSQREEESRQRQKIRHISATPKSFLHLISPLKSSVA